MSRFDFIVVGSGIAGLTFALHAAKHGKVAVVTKRKAGEQFDSIASYQLGPVPEWAADDSLVRTIPEVPDDGIPF